TQGGVQGQGRGYPAPGTSAARSQEAGHGGRTRRIGEVPNGQEGARVFHKVPGHVELLGQGRGRRLPSVRRRVKPITIRSSTGGAEVSARSDDEDTFRTSGEADGVIDSPSAGGPCHQVTG